MNCLTCRRMLLISPREQTEEQRAHLDKCGECRHAARDLAGLDEQIEDAASVRVPEALAHRVLLSRRRKWLWQYSAVAATVIGVAISALWFFDLDVVFRSPVQAVGPAHPGVAAISLVLHDGAELSQSGNSIEMEQRLKQMGLSLDKRKVHVYYAGKCRLAASECDLILLDTADARANVLLVPDYSIADKVLVADGRMTALVSPAKGGSYIVVADSPKMVKRMQRLFRRG